MPRLTYEMKQESRRNYQQMIAIEEQQKECERQKEQEKINAAVLAVVTALGPLNDESRHRVLEAANVMIGTKPTKVMRSAG